MCRATTMATAALLVVAIVFLPLALSHCADACVTEHAAASAPPCHHSTTTGTRVGRSPLRCDHDHESAAAAVLKSAPAGQPSFDPLVPLVVSVAPVVAGATAVHRLHGQSPPGDSFHLSTQ